MAWSAITESDLMEYLSGQELDAFRNATQTPGEADPVTGILAKVTSMIRSYILACPRYTLGGDGKLPEVLHDAACCIARIKIMARAGGAVLDPAGERKKSGDAAMAMLKEIALCKGPMIDVPTALEGIGTEVASPGVVPVQYEPPHDSAGDDMTLEFDYESQDGA
jgi:hypothetical protein